MGDYLFDMFGYVVGLMVLACTVVYARIVKHVPLRLPASFLLFGAVLLAQTVLMPLATLGRLLSFAILCGGFMLAASVPVKWWSFSATWIIANIVGLAIILDGLLSGGRSLTVNPNKTAALLLLLFPFGNQFLVAAALFLTGSRAALAGGSLAAAVALWPSLTFAKRTVLLAVVTAGIVVLVLMRPESNMVRVDHWREALRLFTASPIIGWGPGSYPKLSTVVNPAHAHSAALSLLAEGGLIGFVSAVPMVWSVAKRWLAHPMNDLAVYALLAFAAQNVVDDTWAWPCVSLVLGINLAVLYADHKEIGNVSERCAD